MVSLVENSKNNDSNKKKFNLKSLGLWLLQILSALLFLMAGYSKVSGAEEMVKEFNLMGLGQGFRYLTGVLELLGAVLLLVPKFSGIGGLLLSVIMFGAVGVHVVLLKNSPMFAFIVFLVQVIITVGYKEQIIDLIKNLKK